MGAFQLLRTQEMPEQQALGQIWEHEKTGARLFTMSCDDDNKVFGIGFRTPPEDSTGVAHIVEHCVLSGSRKFKTKEPFMDLVQSSLQTFLNAMTYPDRTIYPVASRHDKDFRQLMDVYLDAVFFPSMGENPYTFAQEGWHYERDEAGKLGVSGVVYNEMHGAMSMPAAQAEDVMAREFRKGTIYAHNSGGDPYHIPDLTYEEFLAFHRRYYHPSNSYLFLYGNMDLEETMQFIDEEYLSQFERQAIDSAIAPDTPWTAPKPLKELHYGLQEGEDPSGKSFLTYHWLVGDGSSALDGVVRSLMAEVLADADTAPLKEKLLDAGIGEDVYITTGTGKSLDFTLTVKNAKKEDGPRFVAIVEEELKRLAEEGLPENLLRSRLNLFSFQCREGSGYPTKGLIYYLTAMGLWVYDGDPMEMLGYEKLLVILEEGLTNGLYQRWIQEKLLDNPHRQVIFVHGEPGLLERKDGAFREALAEKQKTMTEDELEEVDRLEAELNAMQLEEDSPEAKATIPRLHIEDLDGKVQDSPLEIEEGTIPYYFSPQDTQGVIYAQWLFDLRVLSPEEMPYAGLLARLLGRMSTETYDYAALQDAIYLETGGIGASTAVVAHVNGEDFSPFFFMEGKCLPGKEAKMMELMEELLYRTDFSDKERLARLMTMDRTRDEEDMIPGGHQLVLDRTGAMLSDALAIDELVGGTEYYLIAKKWQQDGVELAEKLTSVARKLFGSDHARFFVTAKPEDKEKMRELLVQHTPAATGLPLRHDPYAKGVVGEGLLTSAKVNFVSLGMILPDYPATGLTVLLNQLISDGYLHTYIRAKGGAYGAGLTISRTGLMRTYSYRDPNVLETLDVYRGIGEFLENFTMDHEALERIIIGATNKFNPPLTPSQKGKSALARYLSGMTTASLERELQEVLEATPETIRAMAPYFAQIKAAQAVSVLGNATLLRTLERELPHQINLGI